MPTPPSLANRTHQGCAHTPSVRHASHALGFSLIELLIVLACIAILTTLALPSYDAWRQRSQRSQAKLALMQAAQWLERSATANGRYPTFAEVPSSIWQVQGLNYQLSATLSDQSFSLQATPLGPQIGDACGSLVLDHIGQQSVRDATLSTAACWQR